VFFDDTFVIFAPAVLMASRPFRAVETNLTRSRRKPSSYLGWLFEIADLDERPCSYQALRPARVGPSHRETIARLPPTSAWPRRKPSSYLGWLFGIADLEEKPCSYQVLRRNRWRCPTRAGPGHRETIAGSLPPLQQSFSERHPLSLRKRRAVGGPPDKQRLGRDFRARQGRAGGASLRSSWLRSNSPGT
jgi:hypothetical protein